MATATPQLATGLPGNRICGNHIAFCGAVRPNLDSAPRLASSLSCGSGASGGGRTPLIGPDSIGAVAFHVSAGAVAGEDQIDRKAHQAHVAAIDDLQEMPGGLEVHRPGDARVPVRLRLLHHPADV